MDSGHKNKKIGLYPKSLRSFLRILYVPIESIYIYILYMHAEETSRALREDAFDDFASLRSQLIILIDSSFILNKLTNIAKQDFNSILHKIVSVKEISYI